MTLTENKRIGMVYSTVPKRAMNWIVNGKKPCWNLGYVICSFCNAQKRTEHPTDREVKHINGCLYQECCDYLNDSLSNNK